MNGPPETPASPVTDNPYAAGTRPGDDDLLSPWEQWKALANGLTTGVMTAVLGFSVLWVLADFLLQAYGISDSLLHPGQLSPTILSGLGVGVMLVLLIAAKFGSHARNSAENSYRKMAAVRRKRTLLGEQAASLKRALDERRE